MNLLRARVPHKRVIACCTLAFMCGVAFACQSIIGLEAPQETPDPCAHRQIPAPPTTDDDDGTAVPVQWYAVRTANIFVDPQMQTPGYDLDGVCTCQDGGAGARGAVDSCEPYKTDPQCDYAEGIDNGLRRFVESQSQLAGAGVSLQSLGIDDRAKGGQNTILVYLGDWNGKANDRSVNVGTLTSQGLAAVNNCTGAVPQASTDGGTLPIPTGGPHWDGCDRWSAAASQVVSQPPLTRPTITSGGYVTNGVIVVSPKSGGTTSLAVLGYPITVSAANSTFNVRDGGLQATVSGRLDPLSVLGAIGAANITTGSPPLCQTPLFGTLVEAVCAQLDIANQQTNDFKKAKCDGLSAAMSLTAVPTLPPISVPDPSSISTPCKGVIGDSVSSLCGNR